MEEKILALKNTYPFHMPGHKRNKNFIYQDLLDLDFTEIYGLDNLQDPNGIIKESEAICAKIFGCNKSFFCVNGASVAILATIFAICSENEEIIAMRESHKSFYNAIELRGVKPVFLYSKNFYSAFDYAELKNLIQTSRAKVVFITNPNYKGFCLDIKKIAKLTYLYKKVLIVDESHGSHFIFNKNFPISAIQAGADIVINSLHKTLPCLTQSALLNLNFTDQVVTERIKKYLNMFQTTSPSYILLSVMDKTLRKISKPRFYDHYVKKLFDIRKNLSGNKIFELANKKLVNKLGYYDFDISKLVFVMNMRQNTDIEKILIKKFKLAIEMRGLNYFICLSSIADTDYGFNLLVNAINYLEKKFKDQYKKNNLDLKSVKLKADLPVKEAINQNSKYLDLKFCVNKVCADYVILYPPGVPLIIPGEIISEDIICLINDLSSRNLKIIGLHKKYFLKVLD